MFKSILPARHELSARTSLVFFAINKTGSTSLWTWLDQHGVDYAMNRYQEDEQRKLQLIEAARDQGTPCFTVVRNPWDRAVSSWRWCTLKKGLAQVSFEEFLRIPLAEMTDQQRYHTSPQWQHVVDENGAIDYLAHVGRLEDLDNTRQWLTQLLNLPAKSDLPHLKKTDRHEYAQYYTNETKRLVAEIFAQDIELFGYRFGDS